MWFIGWFPVVAPDFRSILVPNYIKPICELDEIGGQTSFDIDSMEDHVAQSVRKCKHVIDRFLCRVERF